MELRKKVEEALRRHVNSDNIYLEDDDGISGWIVSPQFQGLSSLDRQKLIDKILRDPSVKLSRAELRRILAIAPLTPAEFDSLGLKK